MSSNDQANSDFKMEFSSFGDLWKKFQQGTSTEGEERMEQLSYEEVLSEYEKFFTLDKKWAKMTKTQEATFENSRLKGSNVV